MGRPVLPFLYRNFVYTVEISKCDGVIATKNVCNFTVVLVFNQNKHFSCKRKTSSNGIKILTQSSQYGGIEVRWHERDMAKYFR